MLHQWRVLHAGISCLRDAQQPALLAVPISSEVVARMILVAMQRPCRTESLVVLNNDENLFTVLLLDADSDS